MKSSLKTTHGKNGMPSMSAVFDEQDKALAASCPALRKLWEDYDELMKQNDLDLAKSSKLVRDQEEVSKSSGH